MTFLLKLMSPKALAALLCVGALALTHFMTYRAGRAMVAADWAQDRAQMAEQGAQMMREHIRERDELVRERNELNRRMGDVERKYQVAKADRAAAVGSLVSSVQRLDAHYTAAIAEAGAAGEVAACRTDDPRPRIASECTAALGALGAAYGGLADKARALQGAASILRVDRPSPLSGHE